jgi:hypothetical protein
MKRYVLVTKQKGKYTIPVIETREFYYPKRLGSYCADDGSLWVSLSDGKSIFEEESLAKIKLQETLRDLFGEGIFYTPNLLT